MDAGVVEYLALLQKKREDPVNTFRLPAASQTKRELKFEQRWSQFRGATHAWDTPALSHDPLLAGIGHSYDGESIA